MSKQKETTIRSTVVGLDEVQAKRIDLTLERHFRKPIREFQFAVDNIPKRKHMREKIVEYLTIELEKYPFESEPEIHNFLRSNRDYYDKDVMESILKDEQAIKEQERFVEGSKKFLEHITKYIEVKDNVITYHQYGLETFLYLIDQFDLDDKQKNKIMQQKQMQE